MPARAVSPPADPPAGFVALFNGRDLAGWYGLPQIDPAKLAAMSADERAQKRAADAVEFTKHWSVENGELVNDGNGPFATTDRDYGDIDLRLEYRTVAKADSGIYLRGTPQVQIWDTTEAGGKWKQGADKGSGALWNNSPGAAGKDPLKRADKPFGEWNSLRIVQAGERTWVWLNGTLTVDGARMENFWDRTAPLPKAGPIQLQTHGGEIRWRNVFLRELPAAEATKMIWSRARGGLHLGLQRQGLDRLGGARRELPDCRRRHRVQAEERWDDLHKTGLQRLRSAFRIQAAAGRQQRPGDSVPRSRATPRMSG